MSSPSSSPDCPLIPLLLMSSPCSSPFSYLFSSPSSIAPLLLLLLLPLLPPLLLLLHLSSSFSTFQGLSGAPFWELQSFSVCRVGLLEQSWHFIAKAALGRAQLALETRKHVEEEEEEEEEELKLTLSCSKSTSLWGSRRAVS